MTQEKEFDVIVIGAGVGGLFAALSLVKIGKKVLLLERQAGPGGYATTFERQGFVFESAIHCVGELGKEGAVREFLEETGVAGRVSFIDLENFARILFPGHDFVSDFNINHHIGFLKNSFPDESLNIDRLFRSIDKFYGQLDRFVSSNAPTWFKLLLSPFIYRSIIKTSSCTTAQLINGYIKDEKLKGIITELWGFLGLPPARLSAFYFLTVLRCYYYEPASYIKGGFSRLWEAIVDEIKERGSEVMFKTEAVKIITENGRKVRGVLTDKGQAFRAKVVISNVNAVDTLTKLLDNEVVRKKYAKKLASFEKSISAVQLYIGLNIAPENLGMSHYMLCVKDSYNHDDNYDYAVAGDYDKCSFTLVDHSQIDASLCPQGKGTLLIMVLDSYKNWQGLRQEDYEAKKKRVAGILIRRAEKYLTDLSAHIEVMEVATPFTMQRFSFSPEGAIYGFAQTVLQSSINRFAQETKVKGLFLAGAWTVPGGGVDGCFRSGLWATELALKFLT